MSGQGTDHFTGHGVVIDFAARFPVERTPCGTLGPCAAQWRYVSCLACLDRAPDDPRIKERRRQVAERADGG